MYLNSINKYNENLETQILEILNKNRPEIDFLSSLDFISDGLIDSFEVVMLINEFEKRFGIDIPGENILPEAFCTITAMANLISKLKLEK